jgi:predicted DNA-binding transcriptional regulator AlpA
MIQIIDISDDEHPSKRHLSSTGMDWLKSEISNIKDSLHEIATQAETKERNLISC